MGLFLTMLHFAGAFLLVVVLVQFSAVPAAGQQPGLVAAYSFNEGGGNLVGDSSGSANVGAITGATWSPNGRYGSALSFNGTSNWVTVTGSASLRLTTGMTLEAWVYPTALSGWRTVILKENSSGLDYALYAHDNAARPASYVHTSNGDIAALGTGGLPLNAWTHLAATYDGSTLRLYVNGVAVGSRSGGAGMVASALPLRIGGNSVWDEYFTGLIDEVRVYNRALTAAEIQADMSTPIALAAPPPPPPDASTVGGWGTIVELGIVAVNMVHLHTDKILMYGGEDHGGTTATIWDLETGILKSVPAPYNIFCSGHSSLADGRILVVGGHEGALGSEKAAIFDPVLETWTQVPNMAQKRWYPTATTLPDGRVLVTSGGTTCFACIADIPEIYDPRSNSWTQLTAAQLAFPYYPFIFVLPDGRILNAGAGEQPAPARTLDISTQTWTTVDPTVVDGGSAVMYRPGKIMKSGTSATTDISNVPTAATTYVLDMTLPTPRWRQTAPMNFPRAYHTLTLLPDGNVLVTGGGVTTEGKDVSAAVYEAELWSPVSETWQAMAAMQIPRLYHGTALLLTDGRVVTAGSGDSFGGPNQTTAEFYSPPYLFRGSRPTITSVPSVISYGSAFTASLADTSPVSSVVIIRPSAVTHQFDEDQRYLSLTFQQAGNTLNIDAPAAATLAPPGYYMLFALNANGVPSVARWMRLPLPDADTALPTAPGGLTATGGVQRNVLSWSASSDNVGVVRYNVHRAVTAGFTPSLANRIAQPTTTGYTDTGLTPGTYYYRVTAEDAAGNVSAPSGEAAGTALADTQAPTVSITAPAGGAAVSGTVTITASATDDQGVTGVQFQVDGVNLGSEDTSAPFSAVWDTRLFANSSHSIRAIARDAAGNQTTSSAVSVSVSNTAPPPAAGLVAAYGFNEGGGTTTSDQSGSGNTGTVNGATWISAGHAGQALSFDGVNDRVDINDSAALDLTGAMTLEAWVYPTALSSWRTVLLKERASGLVYALYAHDNSRPAVYIRIGNSDVTVAGASSLALNTWTHLAATYDGSTLRLYVNGVSVGSRAASGSIQTSALPLRIGGNAIWGEYFAGRIDEVRVYNRALTASEIQADLNTPVTVPDADTALPTAPGGLTATGGVQRNVLSWSASSDNVGVVRYNVHRAVTAGFTPSLANRIAQPTTTGYTDTGLTPGTYYYRVTAEDAAGNVSAPSGEAAGTALADTQAPTVSITAPAGGAAVSGTVTITASATDDQGVTGVQFQVDGVNLGSEDTSAPFSAVWDTRLFANSSHSIRAIARDAAGNQTTSSAVSVSVSNTAPPPAAGLVAAYGFNEGGGTTTSDQSGSGNTGTINGATWISAGHAGQALSFDGVNDRVDINDSAALDLTGAMTLEAWVYPTALSSWRTVLLKERASGLVYALYAHDNSRPAVYIRIGNSDVTVAGASSLALNTWTHLAATYDGSTLRLYVNGVSVGSRAASGSIQTSALPLRIGGNAIWGEYFAGRIDEVRVYNRALTASEIQADLNTPLP